jgi:hypothetical protein
VLKDFFVRPTSFATGAIRYSQGHRNRGKEVRTSCAFLPVGAVTMVSAASPVTSYTRDRHTGSGMNSIGRYIANIRSFG